MDREASSAALGRYLVSTHIAGSGHVDILAGGTDSRSHPLGARWRPPSFSSPRRAVRRPRFRGVRSAAGRLPRPEFRPRRADRARCTSSSTQPDWSRLADHLRQHRPPHDAELSGFDPCRSTSKSRSCAVSRSSAETSSGEIRCRVAAVSGSRPETSSRSTSLGLTSGPTVVMPIPRVSRLPTNSGPCVDARGPRRSLLNGCT